MGATEDGRKELIAIADGYRESEQSWKALLLDVKSRGLVVDPKLAIGDGALGFWKALPQVYPATREQRCWVHRLAHGRERRLPEAPRAHLAPAPHRASAPRFRSRRQALLRSAARPLQRDKAEPLAGQRPRPKSNRHRRRRPCWHPGESW